MEPFEPFFMHPQATVIILDGKALKSLAGTAGFYLAMGGLFVWGVHRIYKDDVKPLIEDRQKRKAIRAKEEARRLREEQA